MWNEISCTKLQLPPEPLTRGLLPLQIRFLSVLCPQLNLLNPTLTKFLGTPLHDMSFILEKESQQASQVKILHAETYFQMNWIPVALGNSNLIFRVGN